MPLYEYYCKHCDGIFETIRQIAQSSDPAPCPVCARKAQRVPPTSFAAFTMREGYPRAIPDRGTYYHLGKEVKTKISGPVRMNEHPELHKPKPPAHKSKGAQQIQRDKQEVKGKDSAYRRKHRQPEYIDRTEMYRAKKDDE
jgi:putative FmdB family regulatory protein